VSDPAVNSLPKSAQTKIIVLPTDFGSVFTTKKKKKNKIPRDWRLVVTQERMFEIISRAHGKPGGKAGHQGQKATYSRLKVRSATHYQASSLTPMSRSAKMTSCFTKDDKIFAEHAGSMPTHKRFAIRDV
jgi:hypothetical protein